MRCRKATDTRQWRFFLWSVNNTGQERAVGESDRHGKDALPHLCNACLERVAHGGSHSELSVPSNSRPRSDSDSGSNQSNSMPGN